MGILRYVVLGAIGFVLLPTPPVEQSSAGASTPVAALETHELLSAAIGTVADVATFCARQPQTCEAMSSVAAVAEAKAKYSFKLAYEWANAIKTEQPAQPVVGDGIPGLLDQGQQQSPSEAGSTTILKQSLVDPVVTGSTYEVAADEGTNSLRIEDLIPDWRGPEPSRQS